MKKLLVIVLLLSLMGCQTLSERATGGGGTQLQLRQMQTRNFDDLTKKQALRAAIATLQDLQFVIDKADYVLGSVTGTKISHGVIKMSIIVRKKSTGVTVRANARQGEEPLAQPEVYQNFFTALDKSIFLVKNKVD